MSPLTTMACDENSELNSVVVNRELLVFILLGDPRRAGLDSERLFRFNFIAVLVDTRNVSIFVSF